MFERYRQEFTARADASYIFLSPGKSCRVNEIFKAASARVFTMQMRLVGRQREKGHRYAYCGMTSHTFALPMRDTAKRLGLLDRIFSERERERVKEKERQRGRGEGRILHATGIKPGGNILAKLKTAIFSEPTFRELPGKIDNKNSDSE